MKYFIFAILLIGCSTATAREPVKDGNGFMHSFDAHRCQSLLDQRDALSWGIAFATGLTAGGALGTAGVDTGDEAKDKRIKWGLGITTSVLGAAASSMMVLVKLKSTTFEQYCNQPPTNVTVTKETPVEKIEDPVTPIPDVYTGDAGIE